MTFGKTVDPFHDSLGINLNTSGGSRFI